MHYPASRPHALVASDGVAEAAGGGRVALHTRRQRRAATLAVGEVSGDLIPYSTTVTPRRWLFALGGFCQEPFY